MMAWLATLLSILIFGTWTAPRTWVPGELVTASMMNVHVRDNFNSIRSEHFTVQRFRNLHLRTHPDAGTPAITKVLLEHADEIVMDDATRIGPWDDVVADITASGAGGLDTGSEGASRWYEVYAIAKDDGTKSLLLHRSRNANVEGYIPTIDASRALRISTGTATDKLAQGCQFTAAGPLTHIDVAVDRDNSPTGTVWFTLEGDSSGSPSGTPLATSDVLDVAAFELGTQIVRFIFRTPFTVATSTQYHLVLQGNYTRSDTVNLKWSGNATGGYASGSAKQFNGSAWSAASGVADFMFVTYVTANDTAVTMPSGYTKKALIGQVFNNGSSNFVPMNAVDNKVNCGFQQVTSAFTSTTSQMTDISALVPPHARRICGHLSDTAAVSNAYLAGTPAGYGQVIAGGAFAESLQTLAGTNYVLEYNNVAIEYQGLYIAVSAGTLTVNINGWEW